MSQFKPDQPLEERLKQIHVLKFAMYSGQIFFILIALLNYYLPEPFLGARGISFLFAGVAIFQFLVMKLFILPSMTKKAHKNLPDGS